MRKVSSLLLLFLLFSASSFAYWPDNGLFISPTNFGIPEYVNAKIVNDGLDGYYIIWEDKRDVNTKIYAQRINEIGEIKWQSGGIRVCKSYGEQYESVAIPDGEGGVIVAWTEIRETDKNIYAQKIDRYGNLLWGDNGICVCNYDDDDIRPRLTTDGNGGAIIAWSHQMDNEEYYYDIYAQKVSRNGSLMWNNGIVIVFAEQDQICNSIVPDGNGGAVAVWEDRRTGYADIYAKRVDSNGNDIWQIVVCDAQFNQTDPVAVVDNEYNPIIVWTDTRTYDPNRQNYDIYAQKIYLSSGELLWTQSGVPVCTAQENQVALKIVSDGSGGAVITWNDKRLGTDDPRIYAQRVNSNGSVMWSTDGINVFPGFDCDASGGYITRTEDGYYYICASIRCDIYNDDIYLQKLDGNGNRLLSILGQLVCHENNSRYCSGIVSKKSNSACLVWRDKRNGSSYDIYAQKTDVVTGDITPTSLAETLKQNYPNPFNPITKIELTIPERSNIELSIYDISGRLVENLEKGTLEAGNYEYIWNGKNSKGEIMPSGVYFCRLKTEYSTKTIKMILTR